MSSYKLIAGIAIGAAAGAALVLFLKTEKGKELLNNIQEGSDKLQGDLKIKMQDIDKTVNDLWEKGISLIEELEQTFKQQAP